MNNVFNQRFKLTQSHNGKLPACLATDIVSSAGVYSDGLLTIFDEELSTVALKSWNWLIGNSTTPIMATAFGDIFVSDERGIYFLETQQAVFEFISNDVEFVFNEFLIQPDIVDGVFYSSRFEQVASRLGCLSYGETFVLEPWERIGGNPAPANYSRGSLVTYLNLVGQFLNNEA